MEPAAGHRWRFNERLARASLVAGSLLLALVLAEGLTRLLHPISDRRDNIALDGRYLHTWLEPNTVYRQVSNEYDALTTITGKGHRVPASEDPEVVFLGDSFTFGSGLADEETFASLYCTERRLRCANLGIPGSGTLKQIEKFESALAAWSWRPREVKLFFFGMSTSFSAGNDFVDNYNREITDQRRRAGTAPPEDRPRPRGGLGEKLIGMQSFLLRHSNLMRMLKFYAGPALKSLVLADPGKERMSVALAATRQALERLEELSRKHGFDYSIYLIVPVHDILRGSEAQTLETLNAVAPKPAIATAGALSDDPTQYYYAFDGHLNSKGSRRIAELLLSLDTKGS
ncbi:MAG TPA: SGNH/GDSL hydrolase family protein [Steroidobacteraceae bacterium]